MMEISRIDLADIRNPKELALAVIQQLGTLTFPVPVKEIALASGITDVRAEPITGFEGMLLTSDTKSEGMIVVSASSRPDRQRFTVGHELGHFLSEWHIPDAMGFKCTQEDLTTEFARRDKTNSKREAEANQFACELLMPEATFKHHLRAKSSPTIECVLELRDLFSMSTEATGRRMMELYGEPCALIVSKGNSVLRSYRGKGLPFLPIKKQSILHPGTITATYTGRTHSISAMEEIDGDLWFNEKLNTKAKLFEQVLIQEEDYRMTLLYLDESDCDEDDIEELDLPRFR